MRMLDLFCGRGGWTNAFLERGWECVGVDLVQSADYRGDFVHGNVLNIRVGDLFGHPLLTYVRDRGLSQIFSQQFDFICASSPCEQFSVHGMKHFHPNPPYPELGIKLFNHTREICEASGVPYIMENVRAAQQFVGGAVHHCGPFYLWGTGVPVLVNQGILKGRRLETGGYRTQKGKNLKAAAAEVATIPPELAHCVAQHAERIVEAAKGT